MFKTYNYFLVGNNPKPSQYVQSFSKLLLIVAIFPVSLRPGHTALYGLITAKTCEKVISCEAYHVVRVDVEFKTSYSRFIEVAGSRKKSERRRTRQIVLNCSKF